MTTFEIEYAHYVALFELYANEYCQKLQTKPEVLGESMQYSLMQGGKRIRPVLALAVANILGVADEDILPFALAIEMIHTHSLIHDDLPALDNDDFRRGKPSNHKKYGEATAILAGDALLNTAYSICLEECYKGEKHIVAAKYLNECAGAFGMLAGQVADMQFEHSEKEATEADVLAVYENKTVKLILAPIVIASILADNKNYLPLEQFGKNLGMLFQFIDDILDEIGDATVLGKSVGKDKQANKLTSVRVYELEGAKVIAESLARVCHVVLEGVTGETGFLHELVDYVLTRSY